MNVLTTILKRGRTIASFTKRSICKNPVLADKDSDECVQVTNPFCLKPIEDCGYTIRPHDNLRRQTLYEFGLYVAACLPKYVQKIQLQHCDELEILVAPEGIYQVASFMAHHQHACFCACSSATAVDVLSREFRFEVVYNIVSFRFCERARLKTYTNELTPLHSLYDIWKVCNWYEREIYDMFGIIFSHHPDLRRILTDYGFKGHPLRKDFPLVGYEEVRYDDELKKIVYEPLEFAQEMRSYHLESPWKYYGSFHEGYNKPPEKPKKK